MEIERLEGEVAALGDLSRDELAAAWLAIYKASPPKGARRPLLERAIAWHVQARVFGGLSTRSKRALDEAIRHERRAIQQGAQAKKGAGRGGSRPRRRPGTGARLVREWGGRTHVVDVIDGGYLWQGHVYRSLSVIARTITGARWSGPRFFGL
jgi:hypothetical protein